MNVKEITVVLPSYKPDEKMVLAVKDMLSAGFDDVIVVDDGGKEPYNSFFDEVRALDGCTVLVHPENRGKGAALKTAFSWFLENRKDKKGVITVDGDGQHRASDVVKCAEAMINEDKVILGVRDFSLPDVPKRSAYGNKISSTVFRLFVGMKLSDTQTGLRAIPTRYLEGITAVSGDRYEYETNMLLHMKSKDVPYKEVCITTVYIDDNDSSHFRPVKDSVRIYSLIFKYLMTTPFVLFFLSAGVCYVFDWILFTALNFSLSGILKGFLLSVTTYAGARAISSLLNFYLNRRIFNKDSAVGSSMVKYYLLVLFNLAIGSVLVHFISNAVVSLDLTFADGMDADNLLSLVKSVVKVPVDVVLYIFNYAMQKRFVFKNKS